MGHNLLSSGEELLSEILSLLENFPRIKDMQTKTPYTSLFITGLQNHINSCEEAIEKLPKDVEAITKRYVCVPKVDYDSQIHIERKKLQDYIDFVDRASRSHGLVKGEPIEVKYRIYKELLQPSDSVYKITGLGEQVLSELINRAKLKSSASDKISELEAKINKLPMCEERDNLIKQREVLKMIEEKET